MYKNVFDYTIFFSYFPQVAFGKIRKKFWLLILLEYNKAFP